MGGNYGYLLSFVLSAVCTWSSYIWVYDDVTRYMMMSLGT